jgi:hypothetical protein
MPDKLSEAILEPNVCMYRWRSVDFLNAPAHRPSQSRTDGEMRGARLRHNGDVDMLTTEKLIYNGPSIISSH